jgi:hypothetical protein
LVRDAGTAAQAGLDSKEAVALYAAAFFMLAKICFAVAVQVSEST